MATIIYQNNSVESFTKKLDSLLAKDMKDEAGELLLSTLKEARESSDWRMELAVLNEMSGFYRINNMPEEGLDAAKTAAELVYEHKIVETVTAATTFLNSATTLKAFGKVYEALPYYVEAERIYGRFLEESDYRFAGLYNNMALAFVDIENYEMAEKYFLSAVSILKELPSGTLETGVTYVNMAVLYDKWGRSETEISELLREAMDCFEDPSVERDSYYAFNCRKCADTFDYYGFFAEKSELLMRADKIYEENRKLEEA